MTTILDAANAIQALNTEFAVFQDQMATKAMEVITTHLQNLPDWHVVCVTGYTPSWNDGDACSHSQYTNIDADAPCPENSFSLDPAVQAVFDKLDNDEYDTFLSGENCRATSHAMDLMDDFFRYKHDTNFRLFFVKLDDGTVSFFDEQYDCGY